MGLLTRSVHKETLPTRTTNHSSPAKRTAQNRLPSQPQVRAVVDEAIKHELAEARFVAPDLADHMFGHVVSTELAKGILEQFVTDGVVEIRDGRTRLSPTSPKVKDALEAAFKDAKAHGCSRDNSEVQEEQTSASTSVRQPGKKQTKKPAKGKKSTASTSTYSYRWVRYPSSSPINEDKLVEFLNNITDLAWDAAKSKLDPSEFKLKNRFAAPNDKTHAVPLAYEIDGEDMRPDFLVLPIEAFSTDRKTFDEKYINFTVPRVAGESKTTDFGVGLTQVHRYARGIRRAQPWAHFVVALTLTKDRVALLRGEGSGTERLELALSEGRSCIEFIQIVLGLALADGEDLGQNPDVVLDISEVKCKLRKPTRFPEDEKPAVASYRKTETTAASSSAPPEMESGAVAEDGYRTRSRSRMSTQSNHQSNPSVPNSHPTSSASARSHLDVFCVVDPDDASKRLVLSMSWQDVAREAEQTEVLDKLRAQNSHPNVIVPFRTFKGSRKGKTCTTLGGIRGILDEHLAAFPVENRALTIHVAELKRPTKYFWGVHDFVRGIRGAILGHEYLIKIGILHRDISENNIVLARRPWEERGYLIDFDMAILQEPDEEIPLPAAPVPAADDTDEETEDFTKSSSPLPVDTTRPLKALRTGTTPYMSFNVLYGNKHTYHDDLESFLYVLLFFFFNYGGPLAKEELRDADGRGFTHPLGSGRLSHVQKLPDRLNRWADDDLTSIADAKEAAFNPKWGPKRFLRYPDLKQGLKKNWPEELQDPITKLLRRCWTLFAKSRMQTSFTHTKVEHGEFVQILNKWLEDNAELEDRFSNCPF